MSKVLIIRLSSFGDVALLVPVIYSVAAKYPQDRFSVMTRKAFAPLFENLGFNINVIPLDLNHAHKGITGYFKVLKKLLGSGFSHVADIHDVLRSKGIRYSMALAFTKTACIEKGRCEKQSLIQTKDTRHPLKHTTKRYQDVFDKLGFPAPMLFTNFFEFVPRNFSQLKGVVASEKTGKWISVAPFAKHKGKIYPLEKMENIVKRLSDDNNNTLFLFGSGKEETDVIEAWSKKYPRVINTSGKLKLTNELLLISYTDVMLTMDSANMHLASLVQVPAVSVWGATHPSMGFYGFGQDLENAVQSDLPCRPCSVYGEQPCSRNGLYECLNAINEETVIAKIYSILNKK